MMVRSYFWGCVFGLGCISFGLCGGVSFFVGAFEIFGYLRPWDGPFGVYTKIDATLCGWIMVVPGYLSLRGMRWALPLECDLDPTVEKPWWRILP